MPRDRAWRRRVALAAACALAVPAGIGAFTFRLREGLLVSLERSARVRQLPRDAPAVPGVGDERAPGASASQASPVTPVSTANLLSHLPLEEFFVALATRVKGPDAQGKDTRLNMVFTDLDETWVLWLENAVLHAARREADPSATTTVRPTRPLLVRLVGGQAGLRELVFSDELQVEGSRLELLSFLMLLERPAGPFPIVTP